MWGGKSRRLTTGQRFRLSADPSPPRSCSWPLPHGLPAPSAREFSPRTSAPASPQTRGARPRIRHTRPRVSPNLLRRYRVFRPCQWGSSVARSREELSPSRGRRPGDDRRGRPFRGVVSGSGVTSSTVWSSTVSCRGRMGELPWVRPYFDRRARESARELGLPDDPDALSDLVPEGRVAEPAAALVRVSLDSDLRDELRSESQ